MTRILLVEDNEMNRDMHEHDADCGFSPRCGLHRCGPGLRVLRHVRVQLLQVVESLVLAHDICDRIEDAIRAVHSGAEIAIHVEPEGEKAHGVRVKVSGASRK